jgi:hypothetical protein
MNAKKNQNGQAIVELTVSLVGILSIFFGFLLISKLSIKSVDNTITARGYADNESILLNEQMDVAPDGEFILSWKEGIDGYLYTRDDKSDFGVGDSARFKDQLILNSLDLTIPPTGLAFEDKSVSKIYNNEIKDLFLASASLVLGDKKDSSSIDEDDKRYLSFLYTGDIPDISLEDKVYMPIINLKPDIN